TEPVSYSFRNDPTATFQYVPIVQVLRNVLQVQDVADEIIGATQGISPNPDILTGFRDGSLYREKLSTFVSNSSLDTIFLLLYTDEVEICNPLGAKRGTHKLCLVYFTILNLHPRYRSQLRLIHLVLTAKDADLHRFGTSEVLEPLLCDLGHLKEEGVVVEREGQNVCVKAVVVA
ncbi:unnamed protein product, partial [Ixodes hexagonus]